VDKTVGVKGSAHEELQRVVNTFHKYHTEVLLGDFNAKVGTEEICERTTGNGRLREMVVNVATLQHP
jgi:hypothetical protein